jgi:hypothetical protein
VISEFTDGRRTLPVDPNLLCLTFQVSLVGAAETHGTCGYPEIQDEYDYFSTALYLYSKYNVTVESKLLIGF